jgi:hypothetical protein
MYRYQKTCRISEKWDGNGHIYAESRWEKGYSTAAGHARKYVKKKLIG